MISIAGIRPPEMRGSKRSEMMATSVAASWDVTCPCCSAGNESMMRSIVCAAELVCNVETTKWPVSEAVMAVPMDTASRISPIITTSGSWRRMVRSAE